MALLLFFPILRRIGLGAAVWALLAAFCETEVDTTTPAWCLEVVKRAGKRLWAGKDLEGDNMWAESALPFLAGYLGPGPVVAPLPGLTVAAMVARGYHEPAIHVGGGRVAAPQ